MRDITKIAAGTLLALSLAAAVQGKPVVTKVSGTVGIDQRITITGTGFGQGPNVLLFDDFRSGTAGQVHTEQAVVGRWSDASGKIFADPLLSNGKGMRVVDETGGAFVSKIVFPASTSEVYTSFKGYVPAGYKYPMATAPRQFPNESSLKVAWLMDGDKANNSAGSDYVLAGYGGGQFRVASNDLGGPSTFDNGRDIGWKWDAPVRWAFWAKGNGTQRVGSDGMFQATNGDRQVYTSYKDYKPWFRDGDAEGKYESHPNHSWDRIKIAGYVRSGSVFGPGGHNFVMDDVYVAIGPNAAARVEIGNAATYAASTKFTFVTTGLVGDAWSDTSITATIRQGEFSAAELARSYLYVTRADGTVNAVGFSLVSAVPEPAAMGVVTPLLMTLLGRRR